MRSISLSTTEPCRPNPATNGPTLAVRELAANKVLALFDRAEARDFLDLVVLTRHFELQGLMDLAAQKDTGFDTAGFLEALASLQRFTSADLVSRRPNTNVSGPRWRSGGTSSGATRGGSRLIAASIGSSGASHPCRAEGTSALRYRAWFALGPRNHENWCTAMRVNESRNPWRRRGYRQMNGPRSAHPKPPDLSLRGQDLSSCPM